MDRRTPGQAGTTGQAPAVSASAMPEAPNAPAAWVVLAAPAQAGGAGRPSSPGRRIALVALAAVVIAAVVAGGGLLVSQRIAEQQAVHDAAQLTDDLAVSVVQPALTDAMATSPAQARTALDPLVRPWLGGGGEMVRVKVW